MTKALRHERPSDLHPLLVAINDAIDGSGRGINEICADAGVHPRNAYAWLRGKGAPQLPILDTLLRIIGYRIIIIEAPGVQAAKLRDAVRDDPHRESVSMAMRNRELPSGVHPLMRAMYELLEELDVNRTRLAEAAKVSRGTLNRWLLHEDGTPLLLRVDDLLQAAGYKLKVDRLRSTPLRPQVPAREAAR